MRAMRSRRVLAALAIMVAPASTPGAQTAAVEIELSHDTPGEQLEAERLRHLLGRFDLAPWLFTRRVLIDEKTTPHSHPVLTVGYGDHGDDNLLLSNFVHEQLHWWFVAHQEQTSAAMAELRELFPHLPVGAPDGAADERSSYLHLLVIYLEYQADKSLLGDQRAADVMTFWKGDHYRVLYKTVLDSDVVIGRVVAEHDLTCCSAR